MRLRGYREDIDDLRRPRGKIHLRAPLLALARCVTSLNAVSTIRPKTFSTTDRTVAMARRDRSFD
jgi:hypothetical protein